MFLLRVSILFGFPVLTREGRGESGTDRNCVFEAHGGRGWQALVWVQAGKRRREGLTGEAVRFEVVLVHNWTQLSFLQL